MTSSPHPLFAPGVDADPGIELAAAGMALACFGMAISLGRQVLRSHPALGARMTDLARAALASSDPAEIPFVDHPRLQEASCSPD